MGFVANLCLFAGVSLILFSGLLIHQGRKNRDVEEYETYTVPPDLYIQCLGGVILCMYGTISQSSPLKSLDLSASTAKRSPDLCIRRPNLCTYYHRRFAFTKLARKYEKRN
mmetsp:Transcript_35678/g.48789  ORF Transcript_35678/g.48789 Transcript_35678/m.48789 type:complete len:111 (+) Transcript_35678:38-370(+)